MIVDDAAAATIQALGWGGGRAGEVSGSIDLCGGDKILWRGAGGRPSREAGREGGSQGGREGRRAWGLTAAAAAVFLEVAGNWQHVPGPKRLYCQGCAARTTL